MKTPTTKQQLSALLSEVQAELEGLAKAAPGQETKPEEESDDSSTSPAAPSDGASDDGGSPGDSGSDASASPAAEETPGESAPAPDASASPAPDASASGDPGQDAGLTPEALTAEYAQLPLEELKIHFLACKDALMQAMAGGAVDGSDPNASAGAMPAPAAASPSPAAAPPTLKSDLPATSQEDANGGAVSKGCVAKSENEIALETKLEGLVKKTAEQEVQMSNLVKALENLVKPQRKAVTNLSFVAKTETVAKPLSKSEIVAKLNVVAKSDLKKSERDAINEYVLTGCGYDKIEHLLK